MFWLQIKRVTALLAAAEKRRKRNMFQISPEEAAAIKEQILKEVVAHESTELDFGGNMDFKVHFTEAYFTTDAQYNKGNTVILKLVGVNLETGEEIKQYWSLGKDAEAVDNGNRVQFPSGKKSYHVSSTIGTIIHKIKEGEFGLECAKDLLPKDALLAETWIDTCWQVKPVEFEYKEGEKVRKQVRAFPVEWLGRHKHQPQAQQLQTQLFQMPQQTPMQVPMQQQMPMQQQQLPEMAALQQAFGQAQTYAPQAQAQQFNPAQQQQFVPAQQVGALPIAQGFTPQPPVQAPPAQSGVLGLLNPANAHNLRALAAAVPSNEQFMSQAGNYAPEIFQNSVLGNALVSGQLLDELRKM